MMPFMRDAILEHKDVEEWLASNSKVPLDIYLARKKKARKRKEEHYWTEYGRKMAKKLLDEWAAEERKEGEKNGDNKVGERQMVDCT